MKHTALLEDNE